VILHAFTEAFLRTGRSDVLAAFAASPLLRQLQHQGRAPATQDYLSRKAS